MKFEIIFVILSLLFQTATARISQFSGLTKQEKDSILTVLKGGKCDDSLYTSTSFDLIQMVDSSTILIRIYHFVDFNSNRYRYNKDVIEYLNFGKGEPLTWLINNTDSVFAVATPGDTKQCYLLAPPSTTFKENYFFNILKPVLNKIDLQQSRIFYISGNAKDVFVLINKKVYVINEDELVLFRDYYKKRYSLRQLRERFQIGSK